MAEGGRLGWWRVLAIVGLSGLTLGVGLGGSGRLTYHEAFVSLAAREMIGSGDWLVPTVDGQPWLEKPPLVVWLVALAGSAAGGVSEFVARLPSAVAATLLAVGVGIFSARRFGRDVGLLAGLVQATTFWTVMRGRLAEADVTLACLVVWTIAAFDRVRARAEDPGPRTEWRGPHFALSGPLSPRERVGVRVVGSTGETRSQVSSGLAPRAAPLAPGPSPTGRGEKGESPTVDPIWSWAFFAGLGATSLVKGIGFGAVLILATVAAVVLWDRDRSAIRSLRKPRAWAVAGLLALAWPVLVAIRLPAAVSLWTLHVADRLASHPEHFIGGPWWEYGPSVLAQAMPWTPLALVGARTSLRRAARERFGVDRLLWAWAVVPVLVLSTATVKNAHYIIYALPPLATWAALGLVRVGDRLGRRGWSARRVRLGAVGLFLALGLGCGLGHLGLGPRFDRRGAEWAWCGSVGRILDPGLPLAFLYEDWDRKPYPTPFGPVPHDWAVRLFYLERPSTWRQGVDGLIARPPAPEGAPYALVGRDRDLPKLREIGRVEILARSPADRFDRAFTLLRISPGPRR